ncbi:S9 family peptidase [Planosporangium sp. 12N6]|uniref:S9 family peptidase n=1 Tax=Planosporangium spinosum TaxID=3402278 RepID=UPI003CE6ABD6
MQPSDLSRPRVPGIPALTPDGSTAVVAVQRIDLAADDYTSQLWQVPTDGSAAPRQLTRGWRDSGAAISPDGRWLAFVRAVREESAHDADPRTARVGKPQVWVMPVDGGEARRLTDHPLGVDRAPVWSPDSSRLVYTARVPEEGRYGTVPGIGPEQEPPRRITGFGYRFDGVGFVLDRRRHVFVVDALAEGAEPVQVTEGDFDHSEPDWSPDGELLAFVAARHDSHDEDLFTDLWVSRPDGTGLRAVTSGGFDLGQPRFSPDGQTLFFVGADTDGRHAVCRTDRLWTVPVTGGAPRALTDPERYGLTALGSEIVVAPDGVLFLNENRGAVELLRMPFAGGEPELLVGGERQVLNAAAAGGTIAVSVADPTTWGELAVVVPGGDVRHLTDWNAGYAPVFAQEEIDATAPDGYPVHGWVVRPAGDGPHPVLLMIHGGPFTQYGWRLFDEAQVYAGAGYAVVMGNPRGSSGYGEAHGQAVRGNVGEVTAADLLALLDAALKAPDLDGDRVGVLGGSHGGFMTTWMAAHHGDRFSAAISERAVNAIDSFTGSSDIGWFFGEDLYGPDPQQRDRQSPLTFADRIDIPMLIIHSEADWRCPVEQAQRLYVALRLRRVPVELLLFPGEGHELSRSGLPSHRVARFEAILEWWRRWL